MPKELSLMQRLIFAVVGTLVVWSYMVMLCRMVKCRNCCEPTFQSQK
jgi:hypothetical protein